MEEEDIILNDDIVEKEEFSLVEHGDDQSGKFQR